MSFSCTSWYLQEILAFSSFATKSTQHHDYIAIEVNEVHMKDFGVIVSLIGMFKLRRQTCSLSCHVRL